MSQIPIAHASDEWSVLDLKSFGADEADLKRNSVAASAKDSIMSPSAKLSGKIELYVKSARKKSSTISKELNTNNNDITETRNQPFFLYHRTGVDGLKTEPESEFSVVVLFMPENAATHSKFTYASALGSVAKELGVFNFVTISSIEELDSSLYHHKTDFERLQSMSEEEKQRMSVISNMEQEREELMKQHTENKITEAAVSGGYHSISLAWDPAIQASLKDLLAQSFQPPNMPNLVDHKSKRFSHQSSSSRDSILEQQNRSRKSFFLEKELIDSEGLPLIARFIHFHIDLEKMELYGSNIRTFWTSKPFFPAESSPEEPGFYLLAYPYDFHVRRVLIHWIPDKAKPRTKMIYSASKVQFKKKLTALLESLGSSYGFDEQVTLSDGDVYSSNDTQCIAVENIDSMHNVAVTADTVSSIYSASPVPGNRLPTATAGGQTDRICSFRIILSNIEAGIEEKEAMKEQELRNQTALREPKSLNNLARQRPKPARHSIFPTLKRRSKQTNEQ